MLFNSYPFLFCFLPLLLLAWRLAGGFGSARLALVLLFFSAVFYGFWGTGFLLLLAVMVVMNYAFGLALAAPENLKKRPLSLSRKGLLALALTLNLLPLLWFKYSWFLAQNLALLFHTEWNFQPPGLPLGFPSTPSFRSPGWSAYTAARSRRRAWRGTRCSPPAFPM